MSVKPFLFFCSEVPVGVGASQVFLVKLLIIKLVLILNPVHSRVQLGQKVGPLLANRKEEIRRAYFADGHGLVRVSVEIHGNKGIQLCTQQQQGFFFRAGHFNDLCLYVVKLQPFTDHFLLKAASCDADPFAVQGYIIFRRNFLIIWGNENIIGLCTHGKGGIQHVFRTLLHKGHVTEQVDLTVFQHLQQLRPGSPHVLVVPAGIGSQLILVLIGIPGTSSKLIRNKVRRLMPADADGLTGILHISRGRKQ